MEIFKKKYLLIDIDVNDQKQAFEKIASVAMDNNVCDNANNLVNDLIKREEVSTTGMANRVAIPHTMSADFKKPAIIVARFKNPIDWKAIDGELVKVAFTLLIPKNNRKSLHMDYLQNIALALLNSDFNNVIVNSQDENEIYENINKAINGGFKTEEKDSIKNNSTSSKGLIIGVSACATGVAHTYMAREALEKKASEIGYDVWIETQGQVGQEHKLTDELIKKANYVIIAADINVELDRFVGKKIYQTNTNEAINTPIQALNKTINHSKLYETADTGSFSTSFETKKQNAFMKHFLNGVSHMIPFLVFSGILYAISHAVTVAVMGSNWNASDNPTNIFAILENISNVGFELFVGVMGGYIAMSIAGRAGLAPGFLAAFVASNPDFYFNYGVHWMQSANTGIADPNHIGKTIIISHIGLGIVAAIMMGFSAGAITNAFNRLKVNKYLKPIMPIVVIPFCVTCLLVFPFVFGLSGILGVIMNWIGAGLAIAGTTTEIRILIGLLLGLMVGFDMGGPVNKIAVATATTLIPVDPTLMGSVSAAIPICSLGCAFSSTIFGRKLFSEEEKGLGVSAYFLGFMGISEGAIPFAARRFKQTVIANIIGSGIAGLFASLFFVGGHVGMWGGLIIMLVAGIYCGGGSIQYNIPEPFSFNGTGGAQWQNMLISSCWYVVAIAAGIFVHVIVYIILIRSSSKEKSTNNQKSFFDIFKKKKKETPKETITNSKIIFNNIINWRLMC